MALRGEAGPGTRVEVHVNASKSAPSWAYRVTGRGRAVVVAFDPVYQLYTIRLDGESETRQISGTHLKREDMGYGRRAHA